MKADENPRTSKPLHPLPETKEKMRPITRAGFRNLLKRAITPPASKPHPKSV